MKNSCEGRFEIDLREELSQGVVQHKPVLAWNGKRVLLNEPSKHLQECLQDVRASKHYQSFQRGETNLQNMIESLKKMHQLLNITSFQRGDKQKFEICSRVSLGCKSFRTRALPDHCHCFARASLIKYRSSWRRACPPEDMAQFILEFLRLL